eukprot:13492085-Alexandrium_andersonii.AAC.1
MRAVAPSAVGGAVLEGHSDGMSVNFRPAFRKAANDRAACQRPLRMSVNFRPAKGEREPGNFPMISGV